ncbi:hypothetical protein IG631_09081 [Alternaria alternata]|nr:hypothetical protein IG631_09081 [Alternaria alternata]
MSSFYKSDFSQSNRSSKDRAGSSASAIGQLTGAKEVTQITAIIGNRARDSALQINGHVTDKINHFNFKYLVISCQCDSVKAVANAESAPPLSAAVLVQPRLSVPAKRLTHFNTGKIGRTEISSMQKTKRNIKVLSKATGQFDTICVISSQQVEDNFISQKIVNRLGLTIHFDAAILSSVTWDSKRFCSTGRFVDLLAPMPGGAKDVAQRFHVLKDCPFDMLLGTLTTRSSVR